MHKKLSRLVDPNLQPYFFCLALFIAAAIPIQPMLAAAEAAVLVLLYMFYRYQSVRRRRNVMQYIETITGGVDSISKNSLLNTPLPVVVFRADNGEVIWANESFMGLTEAKDGIFDMKIQEMAPGFDYQSLMTDGMAGELMEMNGSIYQVYGSVGRMSGRAASQGQIVTAYFVDVTESQHLKAVYEASRPVVSVLVLDNYEELMKAGGEAARSSVLAQIDERINNWVTGSGGMLRKYDRDRYLFICDDQCFSRLVEEKFSVLEAIHQVQSEDGVMATLSIGSGKDCDTYEDAFRDANKSIEMALSRGGDQAVVKDSLDFQFYGGRSKSTEKRTKVKSRVMAKALGELIADASEVYVMGHEYAIWTRWVPQRYLLCRPEAGQAGPDRHRPGQQQRPASGAQAPGAAGVQGCIYQWGGRLPPCSAGRFAGGGGYQPSRHGGEPPAAGRLQPGGSHRPPSPGSLLYRKRSPQLP